MKYILLIIVLTAFAAIGLTLGKNFGSFAAEDKFSGKKKYQFDEDPDIQSNMHGEE